MKLARRRATALLILGCFASAVLACSATAKDASRKRIGIVYSQPSADHFHDSMVYSQLFMAMQHQSMMAGIPFDLLTEDDLTDATQLAMYDALIFPAVRNVTHSKLAVIEDALTHAVFDHGVGLIVSGEFLTHSETGDVLPGDPHARMKQLLGIGRSGGGVWVSSASLTARNVFHPTMRGYANDELVRHYDKVWLGRYPAVSGQSAVELVRLTAGESSFPVVWATETGGRNVHFSNDRVIGDSNLVWSALLWVVYDEEDSVGLKLGRYESIFLSRTDMDQSMYSEELQSTAFPLYDLLVDWKTAHDFVGTFYINLGNNEMEGEFTDWNVSAPLYSKYIALGNEIGTHSWTHPDVTSNLSASEIEFEFEQSKLEIERHLGVPVIGAAIPGNPENLFVDTQLDTYMGYVSGRSGVVGSGYPGAIGFLTPEFQSAYFSLNMSPDFTLVEWLGHSPDEAIQIWEEEHVALLRHASQPLIHWLWHDYGPTNEPAYTVEMFSKTVAWAHQNGTEFLTQGDVLHRIETFRDSQLEVSGTNPIEVRTKAEGLGYFSILIRSENTIESIENWYAYDEDRVFLPHGGGEYVVHIGPVQDDLTRIIALPRRANLLSVAGDGTVLDFSFEGAGMVTIALKSDVLEKLEEKGADSSTRNGNILRMNFSEVGIHRAKVFRPAP